MAEAVKRSSYDPYRNISYAYDGAAARVLEPEVAQPRPRTRTHTRPRQEEQGPLGGHGRLALHGVQPPEVPGDDPPPGGDVALVEVVHSVTSFLVVHMESCLF